MDLGRIAVRAIVAYIYLLFMTRACGKRVISQATPFDFVVSVILGDLIDDAIWADVSVTHFAAAVGSLFACDAVTSTLARRYRAFHRLVDGRPAIVVRDGAEDREQLRKEQLNEGDLKHLLRLHHIEEREEVRLGVMEVNHDLSVLRHEGAEPATKADLDALKRMLP